MIYKNFNVLGTDYFRYSYFRNTETGAGNNSSRKNKRQKKKTTLTSDSKDEVFQIIAYQSITYYYFLTQFNNKGCTMYSERLTIMRG